MPIAEVDPTVKGTPNRPVSVEISHTPTWAKGALRPFGKFLTHRSITTLTDAQGMPVTDPVKAKQIANRIASLKSTLGSTASTRVLQLP